MKLHPIYERSKCFVCEEIVYKSQKSVKLVIDGEEKLFHRPCHEQVMKLLKKKQKEAKNGK